MNRSHTPNLAPSSETSDNALSLRLQEASSDRPGGYVGQAVIVLVIEVLPIVLVALSPIHRFWSE